MTSSEPAPPVRDRILAAAFQAFMEAGYAGASTLDIARRAHVSKRDLYAQFGSKQAMLTACIAGRAASMRRALELPAPRSREGLAETLASFGRTLLQEASRPEVLAMQRLAILEAERAPEVARTLDGLSRAENHAALTRLLIAAQKGGLLPWDTMPEEHAEAFIGLLWRGGLQMRLLLRLAGPPDDAEIERRVGQAVAFVLTG